MTATATTRSAFHTRSDEFRTGFLADHSFVPWPRSPSPRTKSKFPRSHSIGSPTSGERTDKKFELRKSKSVHFADSMGLPLLSVLTFNAEKELQEEFSKLMALDHRERWSTMADKCCSTKQGSSAVPKSKETFFASPKILAKKVEMQKICLEKTELLESAVRGTACVDNLSYKKDVIVRFTFDKWRTQQDVQGAFHSHSREQNFDRFVFEIPIPNDATAPKNFKVEFAVAYNVLGDSHWDNNNGFNYHVLFVRG